MKRSSHIPSLTILFLVMVCTSACRRGSDPDAPKLAFRGSSTELEQSVVLATLDDPIPNGRNAIWCGTFQLAWNKVESDLTRGPVSLDQGDKLVARLNASQFSESDLPRGDFYVDAGRTTDGVIERIRENMRTKFQREPDIAHATEALFIAYAYLRTRLDFTTEFAEYDERFQFSDSSGDRTVVSAFGIFPDMESDRYELAQQVHIMYAKVAENSGGDHHAVTEFVIDPCKTSSPNQLVIACVRPKKTLAETLEYVKRLEKATDESAYHELGHADQLLIPNMYWDVQHAFTELEGANFQNSSAKGQFILAARQDIRLQMGRKGVVLESEADATTGTTTDADRPPRLFHANRPFLMYLKTRDGDRPFFVMWVDNAELLSKP